MFSDSNQFAKNIFKKNGAGVAVMFSRAVNMFHNIFAENTGSSSYGLLLKEIFDSDISYNRFEGNTSGLYAEGATRCKVEKNNFLKNGWAIKIFGSSTFNNFRHNNFISNSFDIASNASINNNKYVNNYWGKYSGYDLNRNGIGDIPYRPVKLFSFISAKSKESLILLRSLFVLIMEFAESITPIFTPSDLNDELPLMVPVKC
jgi:nitrous oxidase accessory protein